MSSSAHSNSEFSLVTDKVYRLIIRSNKLKVGNPAAKTLTHEIAMALATVFAQHSNAATSFLPLLLYCAAEIRDKSDPNGRLVVLLDWNAILEATSPITPPVALQPPSPLMPAPTPPTAPTPNSPTSTTPAPAPATSTPATPTPTTPTPTPTVTMALSSKLFVPGDGKHRPPMPNNNNVRKIEEPTLKKQRTQSTQSKSRVHLNKVKSIPTVLDEDEDLPAGKVIVDKNTTKPTVPKDDALGSTKRLFGI